MRSRALDRADHDFSGGAEKERPLGGSRIDDRRPSHRPGTLELSLIRIGPRGASASAARFGGRHRRPRRDRSAQSAILMSLAGSICR